jgi:hypothetical protein
VTPLDLVPMRLTATLAHALPGIRLRLRDGDTTLLDVQRSSMSAGAAVTPCAFRNAVARAHRQLEEGLRLRFLGLPEDAAPSIEVGVRPGDAAYPSGIYRVATGDVQVHAFATTLAPRACRAVLAASDGAGDELRLHHDAATDVTLVHTLHDRARPLPSPPWSLEDILVVCFAEEVTREVALR